MVYHLRMRQRAERRRANERLRVFVRHPCAENFFCKYIFIYIYNFGNDLQLVTASVYGIGIVIGSPPRGIATRLTQIAVGLRYSRQVAT
jgi:hypothetical protein